MRVRRFAEVGLAGLVVLVGGLVLFSAPAGARSLYVEAGHFGSAGTGEGGFSSPTGVAVDQATHDVYVVDAGEFRMQKFSSSGVFLAAWGWGVADGKAESEVCSSGCEAGIKGSGAGQFSGPIEIAVDNSTGPSAGDVYVADESNGVVEKFSGAGAYLSSIGPFSAMYGVATDPAGNVWVFKGGTVLEFSDTGVGVGSFGWPFGGSRPLIAVDSEDNVYGLRGAPYAAKVSSTGTALDSELNPCGCTTGLAVDESTNEVFIDEAGKSVSQYGPSGTLLGTFGSFGAGTGVAVDSASEPKMVYVADGSLERVDTFNAVPLPGATTGGASDVQKTTATVTGTVNPESEEVPAGCKVEYGTSTAYGSTILCSPENVGTGETPVAVTANLTGLVPHTLYHYRVVATNTNGSTPGADQTLTTVSVAPVVVSESGVSLSPREGILAATIDTDESDTTYHFVYGTTIGYGLSFPARESDLGAAAQAGASLSVGELQPGTVYHYAVVATNEGGTTVGPDETFTTAPGVLPVVATGVASGVSQNAVTISGTIGAQGIPTTYEFDVGTDTSYGPRVFGDAGNSTEPQPFTLNLYGLQPGTTYHYRLVASNTYGTTYGADETFTTPGFPTSVIALPVTQSLVATPAFEPLSTVGVRTPTAAGTAKPKQKTRKHLKGRRKGRKAARATHTQRRGRR